MCDDWSAFSRPRDPIVRMREPPTPEENPQGRKIPHRPSSTVRTGLAFFALSHSQLRRSFGTAMT